MKKAAAGCFAVASILAVLLAVLGSIGSMRQEKIRQQPPLTLQELDWLSKAQQNSEGPAEGATTSAKASYESPAEEGMNRQSSPAGLPRRLDRTATDAQRREIFTRGKSRTEKLGAFIGSSPLGEIADVALLAAGIRAGASWERGQANLLRGNWAEARSCFTEYLRNADQPVMQQQACAYLAWLEDDPEVAAQYMDLACSGGQLGCIVLSTHLAIKTDSRELTRHYRGLWDQLYPESARPKGLVSKFDVD
ncbi:MAG TPA: hypothetical protein VMZ06_05695 [Candidatus Bathyarchaeia archaeon]|nr:hypothetical protein [Candidatus Bathyarchaeia archaeon]